jgi:hypothetical protein
MTNPQDTQHSERHGHLRVALDQARRLTEEPRPDSNESPAWSVLAAHVGDLSVLALAPRD